LNRAQQRITALRPYAVKTQEVLAGVAEAMIEKQVDHDYSAKDSNEGLNPLLERRD
jgi:F0F1-type ATP synthase gamma subunit